MRRTALDAYIAKKTEIDAMLARLTALSEDHFNVAPNQVTWGDVGSLPKCPISDPVASDRQTSCSPCSAK